MSASPTAPQHCSPHLPHPPRASAWEISLQSIFFLHNSPSGTVWVAQEMLALLRWSPGQQKGKELSYHARALKAAYVQLQACSASWVPAQSHSSGAEQVLATASEPAEQEVRLIHGKKCISFPSPCLHASLEQRHRQDLRRK